MRRGSGWLIFRHRDREVAHNRGWVTFVCNRHRHFADLLFGVLGLNGRQQTLRHSLVSGDIALLVYDWTIKGTAADGNDVDLAGTTADVARRGDDNNWRFVLDNPFGTA